VTQSEYPPGKHVLLDFWGCDGLTDLSFVKNGLEEAAIACGATILETKLHTFGKGGGVTGVAILAESHISIHSWPEINFAALDIFVCGECDAEEAIEPLKKVFNPKKFVIKKHERGVE